MGIGQKQSRKFVYVIFKNQKTEMIAVGADPCVSPEYATKQNSSHNQGRHIGQPLRHKLFHKQQKPFIKLVDQILKKKKDNPEADVGELEGEIDPAL